MKEEQRIAALEEEVKVLKNEIKMVLLDLREHYLSIQSPFGNMGKIVLGKPNNGGADTVEEIKDSMVQEEADKPEGHTIPSTVSSTVKNVKKESGNNENREEQKYINTANTSKINQPPSSSVAGKDNRKPQRSKDIADKVTSVYSERGRKRQRQADYADGNGKVDLVVIAALTQWADQATATLGKERAEALVDISHSMKRVPTELKDVLVRFIRLSHHKNAGNKAVNAKDYLGILAQLDNLVVSNHRDDALLSVLSMMKESADG